MVITFSVCFSTLRGKVEAEIRETTLKINPGGVRKTANNYVV